LLLEVTELVVHLRRARRRSDGARAELLEPRVQGAEPLAELLEVGALAGEERRQLAELPVAAELFGEVLARPRLVPGAQRLERGSLRRLGQPARPVEVAPDLG